MRGRTVGAHRCRASALSQMAKLTKRGVLPPSPESRGFQMNPLDAAAAEAAAAAPEASPDVLPLCQAGRPRAHRAHPFVDDIASERAPKKRRSAGKDRAGL